MIRAADYRPGGYLHRKSPLVLLRREAQAVEALRRSGRIALRYGLMRDARVLYAAAAVVVLRARGLPARGDRS